MYNPLRATLQRWQVEPPVFQGDELSRWIQADLELFTARGILKQVPSAGTATCTECGDAPLSSVQFVRDECTREVKPYICCSNCGPVAIAPQALTRWQIEDRGLLGAIRDALGVSGEITEFIEHRLWSIGKIPLVGRQRQFLVGRDFRPGADDLALRRCPKAILLVPLEPDLARWEGARGGLVLAIDTVLLLRSGMLHFDRTTLEGLVDDGHPGIAIRAKQKRRRRASRLANIELVKKKLIDFLRSASRHAEYTGRTKGAPELLPRPTQQQLADELQIGAGSVNRCIHDPAATELKYLWDSALDIDLIHDLARRFHRKRIS